MWSGDEYDGIDRKVLTAEVDWFGQALRSKEDVAEDLLDPRYPLLPAVADWCDVVENASWSNKDWALGLWHVMLGQILREQYIRIGRSRLDGRFHLLILAPSSSGKTRAADQARYVLEMVDRTPKFEVRPMVEATTAALVGSATERRVKGGLTVREEIPGLLQTADVLHWDEAEAIFHETSYNINLLRVLNQAMNPIGTPGNVIGKELRGITNKVYPKCSLLLTAVDFLEIPEPILRCGFYQRVGVMRKVLTPAQRKANGLREKAIIDADSPTGDAELAAEKYLSELSKVYSQHFDWDFKHVTGMIHGKHDKMVDAAQKNDVLRPYLEDFAERYKDKLYILAMHNCAMRTFEQDGGAYAGGKRVVEPEDVGRAWVVVKTMMTQFFFYITEIAYKFESLHRKNIRKGALGRAP